MTTKICTKCKKEKDISEFYNDRKAKDGHSSWCIECHRYSHREYYRTHTDEIINKVRDYCKNNQEKVKARAREYYYRPEVVDRRKKYREATREHRKEVKRAWVLANREHVNAEARKYYHAHKDAIRPKYLAYKKAHREQINSQAREYREENKYKLNKKAIERLRNDPIYKLKCQVRAAVRESLKRKKYHKKSLTKDIVGCDLDFLCDYLFKTWEKNYGKPWNGEPYHIDHIIPLAMAHTKEDVLKLNHYTNLQLLTPEDNMAKSDNLPAEIPPSLLPLLDLCLGKRTSIDSQSHD